MRLLYSLLLYLLTPFVILRLLWRSIKAPDYRLRLGERFGVLPKLAISGGVWIHAVSVGEVQASVPLIQYLLRTHPQMPLVITTTTPTGSRRVVELFGNRVYHFYAPYDLPVVVKNFLSAIKPRLVIFIETEIWPNILTSCRARKIPTILASARLSARSAANYARFKTLTQEAFRCFSMVAAQTETDAQRFAALGVTATRLLVIGNIKFDVCFTPELPELAAKIRCGWGANRPVWIAASTHEGEEEVLLAAHRQILTVLPNALLVLVPRHPERFIKVANIVLKQGWHMVCRSASQDCGMETQVFVGDSMGELTLLLAAADVAFIGGSLVPRGGHNMVEPAALGIPILIGPHVFNFAQVAAMLLQADAARQVNSAIELATVTTAWLTNAGLRARIGGNGRRVVEENRGALARLIEIVESKLP